jgi:hypothetical protein
LSLLKHHFRERTKTGGKLVLRRADKRNPSTIREPQTQSFAPHALVGAGLRG